MSHLCCTAPQSPPQLLSPVLCCLGLTISCRSDWRRRPNPVLGHGCWCQAERRSALARVVVCASVFGCAASDDLRRCVGCPLLRRAALQAGGAVFALLGVAMLCCGGRLLSLRRPSTAPASYEVWVMSRASHSRTQGVRAWSTPRCCGAVAVGLGSSDLGGLSGHMPAQSAGAHAQRVCESRRTACCVHSQLATLAECTPRNRGSNAALVIACVRVRAAAIRAALCQDREGRGGFMVGAHTPAPAASVQGSWTSSSTSSMTR